jgi:hypothetical protein
MSTVITYSGGAINPDMVLGYQSQREAGNIVHPILGRDNPDITFRPARLRTGRLELGFYSDTAEEDSLAAEEAHALGVIFNLASTDRGSIEMSYVVAGSVVRSLAVPSGTGAWTLDVDYQEVSA